MLLSPKSLHERLESERDGDLVIIEVASPEEHRQNPKRIPTSKRIWRPDYQLPSPPNLDGLIPTAVQFTSLTRRLGVHEDTHVVLVDHKYDATRVWWLFLYFGKRPETVSILNGGYMAWKDTGLPLLEEEDDIDKLGTWQAVEPPTQQDTSPKDHDKFRLATFEDVLSMQSDQFLCPDKTTTTTPTSVLLWDVRTPEEHSGIKTMQGAARPGRIPWTTKRLDWSLFRNQSDPHLSWLSPNDIRTKIIQTMEPSSQSMNPHNNNNTHIFYCQSGVRTTQLIFGMVLAGWPMSLLRNYDGSWIEWSHYATDEHITVG